MKKSTKHCKVSYEVVVPYTDETLFQIISVNEQEYRIDYLPRPCNTISDLYCVLHKGVRYSTFAKFLKSVK
jgi:hypothetical protein